MMVDEWLIIKGEWHLLILNDCDDACNQHGAIDSTNFLAFHEWLLRLNDLRIFNKYAKHDGSNGE